MKKLLWFLTCLILSTTSAYANPPIDISKLVGEWIVQRIQGSPGLVVAAATARAENGNLIISIEGDYSFPFSTMSVRPNGDILEGTVMLRGPPSAKADVTLRIGEGGATMEAAEPGPRNLVVWLFQRSAFDR